MSSNQKNKSKNLLLEKSNISGRVGNVVFEKNNRIRIFTPSNKKK